MKVAVIIPMYKRHDLTKVMFSHLKKQQEKFKFKVIVAGSEGKESRNLVRGFGFAYIEELNLPVSDKNNALIKATKDLDSDLVCLLGSDDFVEDKYWDWVNTLDPKFEGFYGLNDLYYYSTRLRDLVYFKGYGGLNQTIGAGRVFTKALLRKMSYKLWDGYRNKGLDSNCSTFVRSKGYKEIVCRDEDIFLLDVKHAYNITSHAIIRSGIAESKHLIQNKLGTETFKNISSLKYKEGNDMVILPRKLKEKPMKSRIEVEIIEEKSGLKIGDVKTLRLHLAKALIQRGIAKRIDESKKEKVVKKEKSKVVEPVEDKTEDFNINDFEELTFTELKEKFPEITARSKKGFLKALEGANTK